MHSFVKKITNAFLPEKLFKKNDNQEESKKDKKRTQKGPRDYKGLLVPEEWDSCEIIFPSENDFFENFIKKFRKNFIKIYFVVSPVISPNESEKEKMAVIFYKSQTPSCEDKSKNNPFILISKIRDKVEINFT